MDSPTTAGSSPGLFPSPQGWESTRETLHWYSRALGVVARCHAPAHPKWWHVSLTVQQRGLITKQMLMDDGESFWFEIDLRRHRIVLETTAGERARLDMTAGRTATEMGEEVLAAVGGLGLSGAYDRQRFEDDGERAYEPAAAERLWMALVEADAVLNLHRESLSGEVSPVQFWPHHFDLSYEWFGTRTESVEEAGQTQELPAQINFGLYPGELAYFYANPWPFDSDQLLDQPLPAGARWHFEGWQGSILPYSELTGSADASQRLRTYFEAVYRLASPLLLT